MKPAHRSGTYHRHSALVRRAANSHPLTICWRCGSTLDQHANHRNGKPPRWQAGHTQDGGINPTPWLNPTTPPPPGNWLAPEASTCNTTAGATLGGQRSATRRSTGYTWPKLR